MFVTEDIIDNDDTERTRMHDSVNLSYVIHIIRKLEEESLTITI